MEQDNEKSIQSLIMEISRMYMEKCFVKLKKVGIHPRQIPILAVLYRRGGCSQKELAQELGVKPPTVTVSIQRLEKNGLLIRRQDEKDLRVSRIYLSDAGNAIIKEGMQLARAIYGADRAQTGTLKVKGQEVKVKNPIDAMHLGMGLLPDDRKAEGIIADLSVRENIILAVQAKQGILKKIPMAKQCEIADKYIDLLQIKCASRETLIKQLSGGNQQKVILARWLATNPDFLILDEPTRGIDIGTKTEIQKLVLKLADEGKSLIFISSEIEEMLRTCNRMAVLRDGQKVGEIDEQDMNQMNVMKAIAGGDK